MAFNIGDLALVVDNKRKRYLFTLEENGEFHTHAGIIFHNDIIGQESGLKFTNSKDLPFIALTPTLSDYVLKMPRGAQVIYPKDHGTIITYADIFPGAKVLESGVGSGALSISLLRAIGPSGQLLGYDIREDFAEQAKRNVYKYMGEDVPWKVSIKDIYDGIDDSEIDRIVLDLPEPWNVVKHAEKAMSPGGIFIAYVPQITQAIRLREALADSKFSFESTFETLLRKWKLEGPVARPDHRMVAHTGFLTTARLIA